MDLILNKNTAHDYTMEAAYESYIQNRIDQENRINNLLAECTILNEANTGIITKTRQISVLYEANLKDSIKAKFNKFIQFLKNIWGKFMSNMTKALGDEKTYLEKYSDIINKQKGKSDIKVSYYGNYNKAVDRINRVIVPPFDWNTMHEALSDEENAYGKFFALNKISGMNDFEYDENNELAAQLKEYFIAGEDGQTDTTMDKIDLKSAYNFCWNFKKIQQVTEKDIKNMESSAMKIDQAVNNKLAENPNQNANAKPETAQGGSKEESAMIGLREDGESSDNNSNGGNDGDKPTTSTTLNISKGSGSFQRQDTDTQKANADTQTSAIMDKQGDKSNADYSKEVSNVIDNYMTVCRAVITAKWTGAQQIAKDYMNIIKAHVNSYVGTDMGKGNNNNSKAQKYTTDKGKGLSNDKTNNNNDKQQQNDNSEQQGQQQQQVQQTNANVNANKFSRINRRSRRR